MSRYILDFWDFIKSLYFAARIRHKLIQRIEVFLRRRRNKLGLNYLDLYTENSIGPIQQSEAVLLHAICMVARPRVILEFGFLSGDSSFVFIKANDLRTNVYSVDCEQSRKYIASIRFGSLKNFKLITKMQEEIAPEDYDFRMIDIVFFDGSHDFQSNIITFKKIENDLSPSALVIVHDTGVWARNHMELIHQEFTMNKPSDFWDENGDFYHQLEERFFMKWLLQQGWSGVNFFTKSTLRHGLCVFQKNGEQ